MEFREKTPHFVNLHKTKFEYRVFSFEILFLNKRAIEVIFTLFKLPTWHVSYRR